MHDLDYGAFQKAMTLNGKYFTAHLRLANTQGHTQQTCIYAQLFCWMPQKTWPLSSKLSNFSIKASTLPPTHTPIHFHLISIYGASSTGQIPCQTEVPWTDSAKGRRLFQTPLLTMFTYVIIIMFFRFCLLLHKYFNHC